MRLPTGQWQYREFFWGARDFWRRELVRLKYQNPGLIVDVDTIRSPSEKEPIYLTAEYESTDRQELEHIQPAAFPLQLSRIPPLRRWESERVRKKEKRTEETEKKEREDPVNKVYQLAKAIGIPKPYIAGFVTPMLDELKPISMTPEIQAHAPDSAIVTKAQPAVSPEEPQTTSSPTTTYSRTLTLPLAGLRATEIWHWLRQPQKLQYEGRSEKQNAMTAPWQKLCHFKEQAKIDRRLVAAGLVKRKQEEAEIAKARQIAQRVTENNAMV